MSSLLVTVDALRASHLAQYGYDRDTFPVLDDLLDTGGTHFRAAFANGTNTKISLPSILCSQYIAREAIQEGPTVASALPESVSTAGIHSNTYFGGVGTDVPGFDTFEDFGVSGTDSANRGPPHKRLFRQTMDVVRPVVERLGVRSAAERIQQVIFPASMIHEFSVYEDAETTTDRALTWLEDVDGEFFLWVHYMDPHRPYGMDLDDPVYTQPADEAEIADLMSTAGVQPDSLTDEQQRRIVDLYDSDVRYTSNHVGRLFDWLRERGLWDDLDVILTADHGEEFCDHGSYFHRNRPYDELIHVPLAVKRGDGRDGDDDAPSTVKEQRELLDVAPTVCSFHGVSPPSAFEGEPLFEGDPRTVFATGSFNDDGQVVAARDGDWKYIDVAGGSEELYDLSADPGEGENLAEEDPEHCDRLRDTIPRHLFESQPAGRPDAEDVDEDVAQRLEELGYME
ncbi:sulfatase [Halobellus ordinarius]|uniref:sulfatase n=1 Tax=Halobellus ordinarius TaxID=3075120 RepID=UPI0028809377|nr:sulfatase [Halobellus sp. ZY16]